MGTLCQDQLAEKLKELFKNIQVGVSVDDAVSKAKKELEEESGKVKEKELSNLFDSQLKIVEQRLKEMGISNPDAIISVFAGKKPSVISKAAKMTFAKNRIPFLPVISRKYLGIYALAPLMRNGDKVGYTYLDPDDLKDVVEVPRGLYYIFNVEDGEEMLGKSPNEAEKLVKKQGRSCLTADEVIMLCVLTSVFSRHYVDATGSRCQSDDLVPVVWLLDGKPKLDWNYADNAYGKWGSASCGSRA